MLIVIPIFDRLTALDAVGPYEILSRIPGASVEFVAPNQEKSATIGAVLG